MPELTVSTIINQPVDIVYKAYTDPDIMLKWSADLVKFEPVKGKFGEIGSYAHLHYRQKNKSYILKDELEFLDPGKKIVSQVTGQGLRIQVTTLFNIFDNGTELILIWDGRGTNLFLKILLPFMKSKIKKQAQGELDEFKSLVEEYGIEFK